MAKTRKVTVRLDEGTYQNLRRGAEAMEMTLSEYFRFMTMRSSNVFDASIMDYVAGEVLKQVEAELVRLRNYWREHPERLLQRPPEGGP